MPATEPHSTIRRAGSAATQSSISPTTPPRVPPIVSTSHHVGLFDESAIYRQEPGPLGAGAYKKARDETRMAAALHRVAGFVADFRARAAVAGVHAAVLEEQGEPAERILFEAQRADVVIVGRE